MRLADLLYIGVLWISVCCECCVLSFRDLFDVLITRTEVLLKSVFCDCCVLSGRNLCCGLFTHTEVSYGILSVVIVVYYQIEISAPG